jgi:hypothetical protein
VAADEVAKALEAWRVAVREAEAHAPGTARRAQLDVRAERERLAYQHAVNSDEEGGPEGSDAPLPGEAQAGAG